MTCNQCSRAIYIFYLSHQLQLQHARVESTNFRAYNSWTYQCTHTHINHLPSNSSHSLIPHPSTHSKPKPKLKLKPRTNKIFLPRNIPFASVFSTLKPIYLCVCIYREHSISLAFTVWSSFLFYFLVLFY